MVSTPLTVNMSEKTNFDSHGFHPSHCERQINTSRRRGVPRLRLKLALIVVGIINIFFLVKLGYFTRQATESPSDLQKIQVQYGLPSLAIAALRHGKLDQEVIGVRRRFDST